MVLEYSQNLNFLPLTMFDFIKNYRIIEISLFFLKIVLEYSQVLKFLTQTMFGFIKNYRNFILSSLRWL